MQLELERGMVLKPERSNHKGALLKIGRRGASPALGSGEYGYSSNEIYVYGWLK